MEFLNRFKPGTKGLSADKIRETFISTTDKDFIHDIEKMNASAYMLGLIHAEEDNPKRKVNAADETDIPPIPFNEAMDFLKSQIPMNKKEWSELEPKLQFRAFTVAKLGEATEIEVAKQQLIAALEDGSGYAETWQRMVDIFGEGNLGFKPGYWENVFRTNTQSAYIAGKLQQYEKMGVAAYQLMVIEDSRTSRICKNLLNTATGYGLILPVDHPFWKTYGFPPYHFQCRTSISGLTKEEIGKDGNNVDNISMKEFRRRKFKPMDGFGGNPITKGSFWLMSDSMKNQALEYGLVPDIVKMAHNLNISNYDFKLAGDFAKPKQLYGTSYKVNAIRKAKPKQKEILTAKILEENGHSVVMLPEVGMYKVSNPDALIDYSIIADFKVPDGSSLTGIKHAIIDADKQQVSHVVIYPRTHDYSKKDATLQIRTYLNKVDILREAWLIWDDLKISVIKK